MTKRNLWGALPDPITVMPPAQILEEQGEALARWSKYVLSCDVVRRARQDASRVEVTFYVVSRALDGYRYAICRVEYSPVSLYPATLADLVNQPRSAYNCTTEAEFEEALATVLQSDGVRKAVASLLRESSDAK